MRIVRLASTIAVVLAFGSSAHANATISPGTLTLQLETANTDGTFVFMNHDVGTKFFNQANCLCDAPFGVRIALAPSMSSYTSNYVVKLAVGSSCSETANLQIFQQNCTVTDVSVALQDLISRSKDVTVDVKQLMFPKSTTCTSSELGTNSLWGIIDTDGDGLPDSGGVFQMTNSDGTVGAQTFDTQAPDLVTDAKITGVEDGYSLSWSVNNADISTLRGYQILCQWETSGGPVLKNKRSEADYLRTLDVTAPDSTADHGIGQCMVPPSPTGVLGVDTTSTPDAGVAKQVIIAQQQTGDLDAPVDLPDAPDVDVADAGTADAPTASTPDAPNRIEDDLFTALDPSYICSDEIGGSGTAARVDISDLGNLTNHMENEGIITKILAIDQYRNYSVVNVGPSGATVPARDAWEYYHDQGGTADGGYCFVATAAYGNYDHPYVKVLRRFRDETLKPFGWGRTFIAWYYAHSPPWADFLRAHPVARAAAAAALFPVVVLAAVWNERGPAGLVVLGLAFWALRRWRRRRRAVLAVAAVTTAFLLLVGGTAQAQAWLDEEEMRNEATGPEVSHWAFEFKLGPYYPDVDGEPGLTGNPYGTLFGGGSSLLPQIELDYFPFHIYGELGFGVSAGYMSTTAKSFIQGGDGKAVCTDNTSNCRSADDTTFRMFPLAFLLVYRFTEMADRTVIPLVPYVKFGASYYIWRITKGNGNVSSINGNDGSGATLGYQATLGVTFRAERLDPDAARAMQSDLGVDHIGFFFEVTHGNVSGLWMDNKLHVGDTTWDAGINFEF